MERQSICTKLCGAISHKTAIFIIYSISWPLHRRREWSIISEDAVTNCSQNVLFKATCQKSRAPPGPRVCPADGVCSLLTAEAGHVLHAAPFDPRVLSTPGTRCVFNRSITVCYCATWRSASDKTCKSLVISDPGQNMVVFNYPQLFFSLLSRPRDYSCIKLLFSHFGLAFSFSPSVFCIFGPT